jgi:hypothetical protein
MEEELGGGRRICIWYLSVIDNSFDHCLGMTGNSQVRYVGSWEVLSSSSLLRPQMRSNNNYRSRERSGIYSRDLPADQRPEQNLSSYRRRLGPLSNILLTDDPSNPDLLQKSIRLYSTFLLVASLFFWSWAMYNTFHLRKSNENALDLGIFSFAGTAMSSLFMLRMALGGTFFVCCKKKKSGNNDDDGMYLEKGKKKTGDIDHSFPGGCLRVFTLMVRVPHLVDSVTTLHFPHIHLL